MKGKLPAPKVCPVCVHLLEVRVQRFKPAIRRSPHSRTIFFCPRCFVRVIVARTKALRAKDLMDKHFARHPVCSTGVVEGMCFLGRRLYREFVVSAYGHVPFSMRKENKV